MISFGKQQRFADDVLLIPQSKTNSLIDKLCVSTRYILLCGPRYSGKTFFLNAISTERYNISKFNGGDWLRQMTPYENLSSNKLYESLLNLEKTLVEELIEKDLYHLVKETRGLNKESRRIALQDKSDIVLLMFDAPIDILIQRASKVDPHLTTAIKLTNIERERELFAWPTKDEKFKKVFYVGVYNSDHEKSMLIEHYQREVAI